jgi:hypothetical protein
VRVGLSRFRGSSGSLYQPGAWGGWWAGTQQGLMVMETACSVGDGGDGIRKFGTALENPSWGVSETRKATRCTGTPHCRLGTFDSPSPSENRPCYRSRTPSVWSGPIAGPLPTRSQLQSKRLVAASRSALHFLCLGSFHGLLFVISRYLCLPISPFRLRPIELGAGGWRIHQTPLSSP